MRRNVYGLVGTRRNVYGLVGTHKTVGTVPLK